MYVYLGNRDAFNHVPVEGRGGAQKTDKDGELVWDREATGLKHRLDIGPIPVSLSEAFVDITKPVVGIWAAHTLSEDAKPAWVASDVPELAQLLAAHYGCEIREPIPVGEHDDLAHTTTHLGA